MKYIICINAVINTALDYGKYFYFQKYKNTFSIQIKSSQMMHFIICIKKIKTLQIIHLNYHLPQDLLRLIKTFFFLGFL